MVEVDFAVLKTDASYEADNKDDPEARRGQWFCVVVDMDTGFSSAVVVPRKGSTKFLVAALRHFCSGLFQVCDTVGQRAGHDCGC